MEAHFFRATPWQFKNSLATTTTTLRPSSTRKSAEESTEPPFPMQAANKVLENDAMKIMHKRIRMEWKKTHEKSTRRTSTQPPITTAHVPKPQVNFP